MTKHDQFEREMRRLTREVRFAEARRDEAAIDELLRKKDRVIRDLRAYRAAEDQGPRAA